MHRLLVAAAHKSSGKTTFTIGLAAALRAQGVAVQPYKKGPDYIDPMWHTLAAGRSCINLDAWLQTDEALVQSFASGFAGAELALVEGNHGLFDSITNDGRHSSAALARRLGLPVVLVVDVRGMTRGVAPLLLGYQAFEPGLVFGGVVFNRVGGARHEARLRAVTEAHTDLPVLGAVADEPALALAERHLGLMPCAEVGDAAARVATIAARIAEQVDLGAIRALAARAPAWAATAPDAALAAGRLGASCPSAPTSSGTVQQPRANPASSKGATVRIAIARDRAFGFYYPDDLRALEAAGAELLFFDTLRDARLPACDGLFIGGGFPERCLAELEANAALRHEIRRAVEAGLPTYAECGGLMYLSRGIRWQGAHAEMVGVVDAETTMHARPVGRGYVVLEATPDARWLAPAGTTVHAHEFHHASLDGLPAGARFAWRVRRGHGIDGVHDGVVLHRLVASFAHLRGVAGTDWPARFVAQVRQRLGASVGSPTVTA